MRGVGAQRAAILHPDVQPSKNILEMMKESEEKFEALLKLSRELKLQSKKLNEEI